MFALHKMVEEINIREKRHAHDYKHITIRGSFIDFVSRVHNKWKDQ